jgi:hypothetical protein
MRPGHEQLGRERVRLLLLLPSGISVGMAHEVSELMGYVESASGSVSLVAAQDDNRAGTLGVAEGIDATVCDFQSGYENSVCL